MKQKEIRILLVEDNLGDIRLTQEVFGECGVANELSVAVDGELAIEYLMKAKTDPDLELPDIILLDLNLPKKSGHEVLEEVKKDPILKRIPVIILTTSESEADILKTYDLNANCYITKPVDFDQFSKVVQLIEGFWLSIVKFPAKGEKDETKKAA